MPNSFVTLPLYTASQIRQLDAAAIAALDITATKLMKRAGRAAFTLLRARWPDCRSIAVLCGSGNNAGDGFVVAALAAQRGIDIQIFTLADPVELRMRLSEAAAAAYDYAMQEGVAISAFAENVDLRGYDVLVDGLLGTGLRGDVMPDYADAIERVNQAAKPILSLDIPSGVCADTGTVAGKAITAAMTVSFVARKQGLATAAAPGYTGELVYADLGIPSSVFERFPASALQIEPQDYSVCVPVRPLNAHKGLYGHVMVVAGDLGMGGAGMLAAEAALRIGAGKVGLATQPPHVIAALSRTPEIMSVAVVSGQELEPCLESVDIIIVGPGLGKSYWSEQMLQRAAAANKPMVVDADGLNLLAEGRLLAGQRRDNWVLTPHPGEAGRLLSCSTEDVQADRFSAARRIQQERGGVVVLKGLGTVIATDNQLMVAKVGNPGMAAAGMGDVLSGIIGALMAIGQSPLDAAVNAVSLHGAAADVAAQTYGQWGMKASDLLPILRSLINGMSGR